MSWLNELIYNLNLIYINDILYKVFDELMMRCYISDADSSEVDCKIVIKLKWKWFMYIQDIFK